MRLAEPGWLLLFALVPLPWLLARSRPSLAWPTLDVFTSRRSRSAIVLGSLAPLLRSLAIAAMVVGLARPQTVGGRTRVAGKGVAIVAALDNSPSMSTRDFPSAAGPPTSRLDAARTTFARFVEGRPDDLIGLVVFANFPDRAAAPTLNHPSLLELARSVRPAQAGDVGTNLGDAIAFALEELRTARPQKKVLVLLTDGRNSPAVRHPPLDPEEAARLAHDLNITLHTIAIGRPDGGGGEAEPAAKHEPAGEAEAPDFALLERLARIGRGRAFVAADARALERVFRTIDAIEKSPVQGEVRTRYREEYGPWIGFSLSLLVLDRILSARRLRRLP